jgi:hypothetical protein
VIGRPPFVGDYVVVRKSTSYTKYDERKKPNEQKRNPSVETVSFLSYAQVREVLPDGNIRVMLYRITNGSAGWGFLKWALVPVTMGMSALIISADQAQVKETPAIIRVNDTIPAMDYLDLVDQGKAKAPKVPGQK